MFGYGHIFGTLCHYYGREAGLELREDVETVLEPGMVVSMESMITLSSAENASEKKGRLILDACVSGMSNAVREEFFTTDPSP